MVHMMENGYLMGIQRVCNHSYGHTTPIDRKNHKAKVSNHPELRLIFWIIFVYPQYWDVFFQTEDFLMTPKRVVHVIVHYWVDHSSSFNEPFIGYPIPSADQSSLSLPFDDYKCGVCPVFRRTQFVYAFLQGDFTNLGINPFKFQISVEGMVFIFCKRLESTLQRSNVACQKSLHSEQLLPALNLHV